MFVQKSKQNTLSLSLLCLLLRSKILKRLELRSPSTFRGFFLESAHQHFGSRVAARERPRTCTSVGFGNRPMSRAFSRVCIYRCISRGARATSDSLSHRVSLGFTIIGISETSAQFYESSEVFIVGLFFLLATSVYKIKWPFYFAAEQQVRISVKVLFFTIFFSRLIIL